MPIASGKIKVKPRARKSSLLPTTASKSPPAATGAAKPADPLARMAKSMTGSSLAEDPLSKLTDAVATTGTEQLQGQITGDEGETTTGPPQQGGAGTDPVKWVLGHQAPSLTELREFSESMIDSALDKYDHAPRTKETKAFLDTARELDNELGQLGALVSLARFSGNFTHVGVQAAGPILEVLASLAEMAEGMLDRGNELGGTATDYRDRFRMGRLNFYGRNAPFAGKRGDTLFTEEL
jgi:hypothetical protein